MTAAAAASKVTLYNAFVCPFGARAWMTLLSLKINHSVQWENLSAKSPEFTRVYQSALGADPSSDGKAPTIKIGDKSLSESMVVARFLDEEFRDNAPYSLFGKDSWDRARLELAIEPVGSLIGGLYGFMGSAPDQRESYLKDLTQIFDKMDNLLKDSSKQGMFLGESNMTSIFEIAYFPFCDRLCVNEKEPLGGIKMDLQRDMFDGRPRLSDWYHSCQNSDIVKSMHASIVEGTGRESAHDYFCESYRSFIWNPQT